LGDDRYSCVTVEKLEVVQRDSVACSKQHSKILQMPSVIASLTLKNNVLHVIRFEYAALYALSHG
jgi:hypothetical protein